MYEKNSLGSTFTAFITPHCSLLINTVPPAEYTQSLFVSKWARNKAYLLFWKISIIFQNNKHISIVIISLCISDMNLNIIDSLFLFVLIRCWPDKEKESCSNIPPIMSHYGRVEPQSAREKVDGVHKERRGGPRRSQAISQKQSDICSRLIHNQSSWITLSRGFADHRGAPASVWDRDEEHGGIERSVWVSF